MFIVLNPFTKILKNEQNKILLSHIFAKNGLKLHQDCVDS